MALAPDAAPRRYRLVDLILCGYAIVAAVVGLFRWHQRGVPLLVVAHLAVPVLVGLIARAPDSAFMRVVRGLYPILLLSGFYSAIDVFNGSGAHTTLDHTLQHWEQTLFGMQPSRDWWRSHPSAFWSSVLHAAYLSYYAVILAPIAFFLALHKRAALEAYLDGVIATYLVCYVCYLLIPVAGPYYEFPRPSGAFVANLPAQLVYAALRGGSAYGAAFPSSHVAATIAATISARAGSVGLSWTIAVPTALIAVGVVYCQMHYAIDSAAGIAVGVLVSGAVLSKERSRKREKERS